MKARFEKIRLAALVKARFEKMLAMAPEVTKGSDTELKFLDTFNREEGITKLSPMSVTKAKTLQAPTVQSLKDYDKAMISVEQACRKAVSSLEKTTDSMEQAEEQKRAQAQRPGPRQGG